MSPMIHPDEARFLVDPDADDWAVGPSGLLVPAHVVKRLTAVDLFAGAGGFSLGILEAGFSVVAAVDNDPTCLVTYLGNLGADRVEIRYVEEEDEERLESWMERHILRKEKGSDVVGVSCVSGQHRPSGLGPPGWRGVPVYWFGDASKLTGDRVLESVGLERGELDLVVGGPPCQGFSLIGKRNVADPRNNLTFEFARLVVEMQPRSLFMENVPGILSMKTTEGAYVMDEICRILERGDFGEFDAMRRLAAGDGIVLRRTKPRKKKGAKKGKRQRSRPAKRSGGQGSLF